MPFDWFEKGSDIGGNWTYGNSNGLSACYQSLHIDTSKTRLQFEEFPVPAEWPDFPHHSLIAKYFNDYVDTFDLRRLVQFNTAVEACRRSASGGWEVRLSNGSSRSYEGVIVCNGHHWSPNIPSYPGTFEGVTFHAHAYRTPFDPVDVRGKRVLVVGLGNSAVDIASELSQRTLADRLFVSARRGVWVLPKYVAGKPSDKSLLPAWLPYRLKRRFAAQITRLVVGDMAAYGLPTPDHAPLEAHPTVSSEFLLRCGSGDVTVKPGIAEFAGQQVVFTDGSRERIDVIIYATGYRTVFPFLDLADAPVRNNHLPLFKRMVQPQRPDLWFMGLAQPTPTLVNLAEQQSKLLAAYITGRYELPDPETMQRTILADEALHQGHYYKSERHTMQIDFDIYVRDLLREIEAGADRPRWSRNVHAQVPRSLGLAA